MAYTNNLLQSYTANRGTSTQSSSVSSGNNNTSNLLNSYTAGRPEQSNPLTYQANKTLSQFGSANSVYDLMGNEAKEPEKKQNWLSKATESVKGFFNKVGEKISPTEEAKPYKSKEGKEADENLAREREALRQRDLEAAYDVTDGISTAKAVKEQEAKVNTAYQTATAQKSKDQGYYYGSTVNNKDFAQMSAKGRNTYNSKADITKMQNPGNKIRYAEENATSISRLANDTSLDNRVTDYLNLTYATENERNIYDYILATDGNKAADEFLDYIRPLLNMRAGSETASTIEGDSGASRVAREIALALDSGITGGWANVRQNFSKDVIPYSAQEYANMMTAENISGRHTDNPDFNLEKQVVDAVNSVGGMIPNITMGVINPTAGAVTGGLSSRGATYRQLISEGYSPEQADKVGTTMGLAEGITGYLLGGLSYTGGQFGKFLGGKLAPALTKQIENATIKAASNAVIMFGADIIAEVNEEVLQNKIEAVARNEFLGENNSLKLNADDLNTAMVTAISTAILQSPSAISTISNNNSAMGKTIIAANRVESLIAEGMNSSNQQIREYATALKQNEGERTEQNIGDLAIALENQGVDLGALETPEETQKREKAEARANKNALIKQAKKDAFNSVIENGHSLMGTAETIGTLVRGKKTLLENGYTYTLTDNEDGTSTLKLVTPMGKTITEDIENGADINDNRMTSIVAEKIEEDIANFEARLNKANERKNTQPEEENVVQEVKPVENEALEEEYDFGEPPEDRTKDLEPPKGYEDVLAKESMRREEGLAEQKKRAASKTEPKTKEEKALAKKDEKIEYWKAQSHETKVKTVRKTDTDAVARKVAQETDTRYPKTKISKALKELGDYIVSHDGETMDGNEVDRMARSLAQEIIENQYVENSKIDAAQAEELRNSLKTTFSNIAIDMTGHEHDVSQDFSEWAKQYRNTIVFVKEGKKLPKDRNIRTVEDLYNELTGEDITKGYIERGLGDEGKMMLAIANAWDMVKNIEYEIPYEQTLSSKEYDNYLNILTESIIDTVIGEDIRENAPTRMDKAMKKIADLKVSLAKEKQNSRDKVSAVKERYKEKQEQAYDKKVRKALVGKINNAINTIDKLLFTNSKNKNVKEGQKELAKALLGSSDITLAGDEVSNLYIDDAMGLLIKEYKNISESEDAYIKNAYDENVLEKLENVSKMLEGKTIADLTTDELSELADAYTMVAHTIKTSGKLFNSQKNEGVKEAAESVRKEIGSLGVQKKGLIEKVDFINKLGWQNLKPVALFDVIGSDTLKNMFGDIRKGEDTWALDVRDARRFYQEEYSRYDVKKWDLEETKTFKGLELRLGNIMELYIYSQRAQAMGHIENGGITLENYVGKDGKTQANSPLVSFNKDEVKEITNTLTEEQKAFADSLQKYLSTTMAEKGNSVSMQMYGINLFNDSNFWHINVASDFKKTPNGKTDKNPEIKNASFTKDTVEKAKNPMVLGDLIEDWAKQVNDMAKYHAFVLPMENFNRVFKFQGEDWSVQRSLTDAFNSRQVTQSIDHLINSLNGGARADSTAATSNKLLSLFKRNAVFASMSVFVQQGTAVIRGMAYIDPKYWRPNIKLSQKAISESWAEMNEYAPVTIIKEMGYFDTNVGKSTNDYIIENNFDTGAEKVQAFFKDSKRRDDFFSYLPSYADQVAWVSMWDAVKRETEAKGFKPGTEKFFKKAGERFTDVCIRTQVYDSTMARSELMRSTDTGVKMATAFMAEPTTMMSMWATAKAESKRGNKKLLVKTASAIFASQLLNDFIKSFVYAARDDDEDKSYWEKYVKSFGQSFVDDILLHIPNSLPYIKDIFSILAGNDVERSDMTMIASIINQGKEVLDKDTSFMEKIDELIDIVGYATNIPAKNIKRDMKGIYNIIEGADRKTTGVGVKDALYEGLFGKRYTKSDVDDRIRNAYMKGNSSTAKELMYRYWDSPMTLTNSRTGEKLELTQEESSTYYQNLEKYTDRFYSEVSKDPLLTKLSKEEQSRVFDMIDNKVKALCEDAFWQNHGEKPKDINVSRIGHFAILCVQSGDKDVDIDSMRKLVTGASGTRLQEQNVKEYFFTKNSIEEAMYNEDYDDIDKLITWMGSPKGNSNITTVLSEHNTDVKHLLAYSKFDTPVSARYYFEFDDARDTARNELNNGNENGMTWFTALTQIDNEEIRESILRNDDSNMNTVGRREFYYILKPYGFSMEEALEKYETTDGTTWEGETNFNNKLSGKEVAYMLMNDKKIPESAKHNVYEQLKAVFNKPYAINDWGKYSYESTASYINRKGYTYGSASATTKTNSLIESYTRNK